MATRSLFSRCTACTIMAISLFLGSPQGFSQTDLQKDGSCPVLPSPSGDHVISPDGSQTSPIPEDDKTVRITVQDAIHLVLQNNRALRVETFNPEIRRTAEDGARSAFDPVLSGEYARFREKSSSDPPSGRDRTQTQANAELGISGYLPTGTGIDLEMSTRQSFSELYGDDIFASRLGLTITQALLKGVGLDYNLAVLRQARLDTTASEYELRGFAEALVAEVEETYWDYALNQRQIEIFLESLSLAERQKIETEEMIRIGYLAESELAAAQAEIALRREGLINAKSSLEKTRIKLLRLLNPPVSDLWQLSIALLHQPSMPQVSLDEVEAHVAVALLLRSDLNQARLNLQRGDLQVVKTRNGLLPRLDFFITLGRTGYAETFGRSVRSSEEASYDIGAGLMVDFPLVNRQARAQYQASLLSRGQADEALENLTQSVEVDVRTAYIEICRAREQITATAATRSLQEEKTRIETEKFHVGKSTTLLVAQAQRDLLSSQIGEIQAVTNALKALITLYRLEGSLLERRGISVPGTQSSLIHGANQE
ncbi:MAG TPA: TolC family protein [Deltaproteobacteria bacterium]|nr:TolC family protein [Deltaproteobacteria bacterium]